MSRNRAKRLVMQPRYRMKVMRDRKKYSRKAKHRKAPFTGGFSMMSRCRAALSHA
jgi:stalled ribosome alternative rescue factor ArfA